MACSGSDVSARAFFPARSSPSPLGRKLRAPRVVTGCTRSGFELHRCWMSGGVGEVAGVDASGVDRSTRRVLLVASCLVIGVLLACSGEDKSDTRTGSTVAVSSDDASIVARNQGSDGSGLLVDSLDLPAPGGFVVMYADGGGAPGQQLAVSALVDAGEHIDLKVVFAEGSVEAGSVWVMVYADSDLDGAFDPEADEPVSGADGVLVVPIDVEVAQ